MKLRSSLLALALSTSALAMPALAAMAHAQTIDAAAPIEKKMGPADIIMPHITDSHKIDLPWFSSLNDWSREFDLPEIKIPIAGHTLDMSLTKHVVFEMVAGIIALTLLLSVAGSHKRHSNEAGRPKGFAAGMEAVILYLRNEIYLPVLGGHGGGVYVPFCLTLFFFILFCNLLGLLPWGSTPTGNIAVTLTLAAVTFVVVEVAGMKALGKDYIGTIIYWPHGGHPAMKLMTIIMTPVEIVGKFTKPFALTIRLFANMIAGHVIILALIGLIFMFGFKIAVLPVAMALFIMLLEILVAFIQAFIFSLLAAVFIGQIRTAHH